MFNHPEAKNIVITPTYTTAGGSQLNISVSGSMDTSFMKLMGFSSLNIGSTSTVKWGMNRLRVALALDNTGSMYDAGKIGALKTATKNLLTQLKNAATNNGDVYVSIIPFSKDVNVSEIGYIRPDWIDSRERHRNRQLERQQRHLLGLFGLVSAERQTTARTRAATGRRPTTTPGTAASWIVTRTDDVNEHQCSRTANSKLFPAEQY